MATVPSDWTSPEPESAWYEFAPPTGEREVCRTDGYSFLDDLIGELRVRLESFPAGRPPVDWAGASVSSGELPGLGAPPVWTRDVSRALYAVVSADGAGAFAAAVAADALGSTVSISTLRAAIWETIPSVVRDESGAVLPSINPTTGARRRAPGNTPDRVRLPTNTTPPAMGAAPPAPMGGVSGQVCGPPTPDRDLESVESVPWVQNPLFWLALGAGALLLGSSISNRGPKIGKFDPSKRRRTF